MGWNGGFESRERVNLLVFSKVSEFNFFLLFYRVWKKEE